MFSLQSRSSAGKITKNIKKLICLLLAAMILMGSVVLFPKEAKAAPFHATADMLQGTAYAVLTRAGELIFFRSNNTYTAGTGKTVTDIKGNTYTGRVYTRVEATGTGNPPWYSQRKSVKSVRVAAGQAVKPKSTSSWFYEMKNLTMVDAERIDTQNATTMRGMFKNCSKISSLDVSGFDTSGVKDMDSMFSGCSGLSSLDVSGFNTSNVTDMGSMFYACKNLSSLDVSGFDTSGVKDMDSMFGGCLGLSSLDVSGFNTSNVTDMGSMFYACKNLSSLDVSGFDTSGVKDMDSMFFGCSKLSSLDVSSFDTGKVTAMNGMFFGCGGLSSLDVSGFDTSNVTNMESMFHKCTELSSLDLSGFDTSKVTYMGHMFHNCINLTSLDVSGFTAQALLDAASMFEGCESIKKIDLSNFAPSVYDFGEGVNEGAVAMFKNCRSLEELDISGLSTEGSLGMPFRNDMFSNAENLKKITVGSGYVWHQEGADKLPDPPQNETYTGMWIREDKAYGPFAADEFATNYTPAMAGTWVWEKAPTEFTAAFYADSATGSMPNQTLDTTADSVLPANTFKKFGYTFDHWDDGQGHTYADGATIPAGTYTAGDTVTLTAVFVPRNTTVNMEDGAFDLYIYGNETATFSGLPAGTNYQVYEETPDGWVLVSEENISGIIHPLETAEAKFVNRYQPGTTSVRFSGVKTLDGSAAPAGSFTFELLENDAVIQTKTVTDGGFVLFDEIVYTSADVGVHRYKIREVPSEDEYDYDTHIEEITVTVVDNGDGTMSATTVYDQDGIRFINSTRPGSLRLTKRVTNQTAANENDEFTFKIKLTTPNGQVIDDDLYWYIEGQNQP